EARLVTGTNDASPGPGAGHAGDGSDDVRRIVGLASLESLGEQTGAERSGRVVVLADQDDVAKLMRIAAPWPALVVASRDALLPPGLSAVPTVLVDSTRLALATLSASFDTRP